MTSAAQPNRLAHESSPYLLQHAHNPVDWFPWGEEALSRARTEQKPILVSIGYAACHWCHVMERESFEHEQIARVMNERFVCIKVDREERPDVDQVYMDAVQAMGVGGGWPLNVFLTPEAKPFYGGTYFPPRQWFELLQQVSNAYASSEHRPALDKSAEDFVRVLRAHDLEKYGVQTAAAGLSRRQLQELLRNLAKRFDTKLGGTSKAPKFAMPVIWRFLLRAHALTGNHAERRQLELTLREMAWGGIYDQVGGGFARYSVDAEWLVPHFEKMAYDNGQLLSLYAEAYQATQDELYRDVVAQTVTWLRRELTSPEGGFYSSLDADSEGEEGKFYVYTLDELREALGDEAPLAADYYHCTAVGNWEHGRNILHRRHSDHDFAQAHQLTPGVVAELVQGWREKLLTYRSQRVRPGLDDKILTGWNALLLRGLVDAYRAFHRPDYLQLALQNAEFIEQNLRRAGGGLWRTTKNGRATIPAFLEDYALLIDAYTTLYEATFAESWLQRARELTEYVLRNFHDPAEPHFFYTDATAEALIARKKELFDNVIPSSNSVMAHNLLRLGTLLDVADWRERAAAMLAAAQDLAVKEPQHLAGWAALYLSLLAPLAEVAIVGPEAEAFRRELSRHLLPNAVLTGTAAQSELPLLRGRGAEGGPTTIYVCYNHACQRPVHSVAEALAQIQAAGLPE
ncbi:thioredoxin domain-containing protein [Hymenobacter jeollabukensis]|uniref:Thioredoxin domain-containing protein n=1 Tax=Hymenobacter jeollabukensis TaxID=2025313 RepID=A0A5R8WR25_9BACT|nr:thioredoxin domain-containing protein [Hymenobacter jeollabukensis]TLM92462.1 thioredoxin domain-containing protein [Hymenobacter jeollabukensis]